MRVNVTRAQGAQIFWVKTIFAVYIRVVLNEINI